MTIASAITAAVPAPFFTASVGNVRRPRRITAIAIQHPDSAEPLVHRRRRRQKCTAGDEGDRHGRTLASAPDMPGVAVVTDTTHYLPREVVEAEDIRLVSLYVNWPGIQEREADMACDT